MKIWLCTDGCGAFPQDKLGEVVLKTSSSTMIKDNRTDIKRFACPVCRGFVKIAKDQKAIAETSFQTP